ncbi:beta-secretase 1 [Aplysia californica]|uniref:Beta-secretase 1 n=1 Tax=Aplysia californica TaxID=6500 RepID=A0ABM0K2Z9_APLCA|nr:beta-secretase 1 [Aplysia californica]
MALQHIAKFWSVRRMPSCIFPSHPTAVALIVLLMMQSFFVPCVESAFRLPIRRFNSHIHVKQHTEKEAGGRGSFGSLVVLERDVLSSAALGDMKNNLNGLSGDGYYIDVDIGSPPQRMQILIDTGSANFAVAAEQNAQITHYFHRDNSSTYREDGKDIYVPYTEGEWRGTLGTDIVSIPSAPNVSAEVNIACITSSKDFFIEKAQWQGILGLAYADLAQPDSSLVPFWDSLIEQNPELEDVFSMLLCGSSFVHTRDEPLMEGTLIFGGIDPSLSASPILYTPIYKTWYYEVVITDMAVDDVSLDMDCKEYNFDKTIVDSGTTTIRLPYAVFKALVAAIERTWEVKKINPWDLPGESFFSGEDILCFSDMEEPFELFPVVSFYLLQSENSSFRLDITAQHYLRPVQSVDGKGLVPDEMCVKFGFSPSTTGAVLGAVLMEAFYVVFDRNNSRVGFGQTTCPLPDPDHPIRNHSIVGPLYTKKDLRSCAYKKPDSHQSFLVVSYVMAGLAVVVVLPLLLLLILWVKNLLSRKRHHCADDDGSETRTVLSDSQ